MINKNIQLNRKKKTRRRNAHKKNWIFKNSQLEWREKTYQSKLDEKTRNEPGDEFLLCKLAPQFSPHSLFICRSINSLSFKLKIKETRFTVWNSQLHSRILFSVIIQMEWHDYASKPSQKNTNYKRKKNTDFFFRCCFSN